MGFLNGIPQRAGVATVLVAVIMAGGRGERFWPRSRRRLPKQLLSLASGNTMIQETVRRIESLVGLDRVFVVTGEEHASIVAEQLPRIPASNILREPCARNTAPCIGLAAICLQLRYRPKDPVMIVLPADHLIADEGRFVAALTSAIEAARSDECLVTLGIRPTHPETGYGYVQYSDDTMQLSHGLAHRVSRFTEKPDLQTASAFLADGRYLWNSGVFVFRASTILTMFERHLPNVYKSLLEIAGALGSEQERDVLAREWAGLPSISIDYGIMEKSQCIYVVPGSFGWNDVGSWAALDSVYPKDEHGNASVGYHVGIDTSGCVIHSPNRLVATVGVSDLIIVETDDVSLVCTKERAQEVKKVLDELRAKGLEDYA